MVHRKVRNLLVKIQAMEITKKIKRKEQLREEALAVATYLIQKDVLKKAFYEFHSLIALGQFINLGFVLVGSISAIYGLMVEMNGLGDKLKLKGSGNFPNWQETSNISGDDVGVEVDAGEIDLGIEVNPAELPTASEKLNVKEDEVTGKRVPLKKQEVEAPNMDDIDSIFGEKPRKKHKKGKDKEKKDGRDKKKKKKSAMDDIFG